MSTNKRVLNAEKMIRRLFFLLLTVQKCDFLSVFQMRVFFNLAKRHFMILIADSGSTKTDWILLDLESGQRTNFVGQGLNPYYSDDSTISNEINRLFENAETGIISNIYFYGAGCSTDANKQLISKGLKSFFTDSSVDVFQDMEGAAHTLCKTSEGIACILGTGSNAVKYNGKEIVQSAVSLGYLLGDEGSGNHLGKKLIHAIFLKTAPRELIQDFENTFNLSVEELLKAVYQKPFPSRFLASFAEYIWRHKDIPFIKKLIYNSFEEFLILIVLPLNQDKKLPVHFTGSIAWFFKDELAYIIDKLGFTLGNISQKPIEDLADYHFIAK